jgi:RNA polymerase sigma-70 factor (ECF subfamily)
MSTPSATLEENVRLTTAWSSMDQTKQAFDAAISGCIKGDRLSQKRVYEQLYGKMLAVCLRYTKNHDQAKDILQDGFIKVFNSVGKFTHDGSFEGWVRRIMVHTAIDHFRRSKNAYLLLGEDHSMEEFEDISEDAPEADDLMGLRPADIINAMQKLSPVYRTVLNLFVFEGMTHVQVAESLGIGVGTSKSNLAKAKAKLKRLLQQAHPHLS